LLLVFGKLGL